MVELHAFIARISASETSVLGLYVQTGAVVISAFGVAGTIFWSQRIAKKRSTLDIVLKEESDPRHLELRARFTKLRDGGNLEQWLTAENASGKEIECVRAILNQYELVAIGIRQGIMCEESYKKWCRTMLVKDWTKCKSLVVSMRESTGVPTYFIEFESLAKKWATKNEKQLI